MCDGPTDGVCVVKGCDARADARELCRAHYARWHKHGRFTTANDVSPAVRFWSKVDRSAGPDGCWPWLGGVSDAGYGRFRSAGSRAKGSAIYGAAHRWAYEETNGRIPDGYVLDHACHGRDEACPGGSRCPHRRCVNPAHLEPVTQAENVRRGMAGAATGARHAARTHCKHGHAFTPENTRVTKTGVRVCRTCARVKALAWYRRQRAAAV